MYCRGSFDIPYIRTMAGRSDVVASSSLLKRKREGGRGGRSSCEHRMRRFFARFFFPLSLPSFFSFLLSLCPPLCLFPGGKMHNGTRETAAEKPEERARHRRAAEFDLCPPVGSLSLLPLSKKRTKPVESTGGWIRGCSFLERKWRKGKDSTGDKREKRQDVLQDRYPQQQVSGTFYFINKTQYCNRGYVDSAAGGT